MSFLRRPPVELVAALRSPRGLSVSGIETGNELVRQLNNTVTLTGRNDAGDTFSLAIQLRRHRSGDSPNWSTEPRYPSTPRHLVVEGRLLNFTVNDKPEQSGKDQKIWLHAYLIDELDGLPYDLVTLGEITSLGVSLTQ